MPLSKPLRTYRCLARGDRADALLVAAAGLLCAILATWLIVWLAIVRPRVHVAAMAAEPSPAVGSLASFVGSVAVDDFNKAGGETTERLLDLTALAGFLKDHSDRPLIMYLSVPSFAIPRSDNAGKEPSLAADGTTDPDLNLVIDTFLNRPGKQKVLLLLDTCTIGSDLDLGLFADDAVARLARRAEKEKASGGWDNFGILCACGIDQFSLPLEAERRTLFASCVAKELARAGTVKKLCNSVPGEVSDLAQYLAPKSRQIPLYLGDPGLDFAIPMTRITRDTTDPWEAREPRRARKELHAHYVNRDYFAERKAYRDPAAWRRYLSALRHAELLYRAGRFNQENTEATNALNAVKAAQERLLFIDSEIYVTLADGLRVQRDPAKHKALRDKRDALNRIVARTLAIANDPPRIAVVPDRPPPIDGPKPENAKGNEQPKPVEAANAAIEAKAPKAAKGDEEKTLVDLIESGREDHPWSEYVEGRLITWAITYQRFRPDFSELLHQPDLPKVLAQAIEVEILAEEAMASAPLDRPTVTALIQRADTARRNAVDRIFAPDDKGYDDVRGFLAHARADYSRVIRYGKALDLIRQIAAELPFFGAWSARRFAIGPEIDPRVFGQLIDGVRALSLGLEREPGRVMDNNQAASPWEKQLEQLEKDYKSLRDSLEIACKEALSKAEDSPKDWDCVDDLLSIPVGIPAETRLELLTLARKLSREALPTEALVDGSAQDEKTRKLRDATLSREVTTSTIVSPEIHGGQSKSAPPVLARPHVITDPNLAPVSDPIYGRRAQNLLALESALLSLGIDANPGVSGRINELTRRGLDRDADLDGASAIVRGVREEMRSGFSGPDMDPGTGSRTLAQWALPPQPATGGDPATDARSTWLLAEAERLIEDLDVDRAERLLKDVKAGHAQRVESLTKRLGSLRVDASTPALQPVPKGDRTRSLGLEDSLGLKLPVALRSNIDDMPSGLAALRLDVASKSGKNSSIKIVPPGGKTVVTAPVRTRNEKEINYYDYTLNAAGIQSRGGILERLVPKAFFRGRVWEDSDGYLITVNGGGFLIEFASDMEVARKEKVKGAKDQFKDHPEDCYLYPGASHTFLVTLTLTTSDNRKSPTPVTVVRKFKGKPESPALPLTLIPGTTHPLRQPYEAPAVANDPKTALDTLDFEVYLGRREDGLLLGQRSVKFYLVDTSKAFTIRPHLLDGGLLAVDVTRNNDQIGQDLDVGVSVTGAELQSVKSSQKAKNGKISMSIRDSAVFVFKSPDNGESIAVEGVLRAGGCVINWKFPEGAAPPVQPNAPASTKGGP